MTRLLLLRLSPVVLLIAAAALWINDVQSGGPHVIRNLLPPFIVIVLATIALARSGGRWSASEWSLGTAGFAIPALGLSLYLHYAYATNLNDLFGESTDPDRLFRFLPWYTAGAGAIGFAIGWIIGRRL